MSDANHDHDHPVIFYLVNDAIVANTESIEAIWAGQELHAVRARIVCEGEDLGVDTTKQG